MTATAESATPTDVEQNRTRYVEPSALSIGRYASQSTFDQLSTEAVQALKIRIVDSIGCAGGSHQAPPVRAIRQHIDEFPGPQVCTLIGGGRAAPEHAALYNGALVRYLDFNDAYASRRGGGGHPSDNLSAILAAAEYEDASGTTFLTAAAVAYHVQCRIAEMASNTRTVYDHTTVGAYSSAAGVARALGLDVEQSANAIGISAVSQNGLYATRTGGISHWKGLAFPSTGSNALRIGFLARRGVTGPQRVIEGTAGFIDTFTTPFYIDWSAEDRNGVLKTVLKRYNAQIHSQAPIEGVIELKREHGLTGAEIDRIEVAIFQNAYDSVGGGRSGPKWTVATKEEADHSLPYMLAAAALDGEMTPRQYDGARILRADVQDLLRKVTISPDDSFTARFPREHACRITITLKDGRTVSREKHDYAGFATRPMTWADASQKTRELWDGQGDSRVLEDAIDLVGELENHSVRDLCALLGRLDATV